MYKILISGYYGFNNIGDESILRTVIDNLREKLPQVDITVLSQSPAQTAEKYGVKAAARIGPAASDADLLLPLLPEGKGRPRHRGTGRIPDPPV